MYSFIHLFSGQLCSQKLKPCPCKQFGSINETGPQFAQTATILNIYIQEATFPDDKDQICVQIDD